MENLGMQGPSPADLAAVEAELPEWDRLRVRDYWDAVIASETKARPSPASPYVWPDHEDPRVGATVLRLVTRAESASGSAADQGEAA